MNAMRLLCLFFLLTSSLLPRAKHLPAPQASADEHYIAALMQKYHLENKKSPFTYQYKTEIYNNFLGKSMKLPDETEELVKDLHAHLNNSFFYKDISLLSKPLKVRAYQLKKIVAELTAGTSSKQKLLTATPFEELCLIVKVQH